MRTKLLNKMKEGFEDRSFDLDFETKMVQSRILSTLLQRIDELGYTQEEIAEKSGLKQPFLSALFHNKKKLNMSHIALLQNALEIVIQPPSYLTDEEHKNKFYSVNNYDISEEELPMKTN